VAVVVLEDSAPAQGCQLPLERITPLQSAVAAPAALRVQAKGHRVQILFFPRSHPLAAVVAHRMAHRTGMA
jgi:hypothetical protein